jgi:hypothetical protein
LKEYESQEGASIVLGVSLAQRASIAQRMNKTAGERGLNCRHFTPSAVDLAGRRMNGLGREKSDRPENKQGDGSESESNMARSEEEGDVPEKG